MKSDPFGVSAISPAIRQSITLDGAVGLEAVAEEPRGKLIGSVTNGRHAVGGRDGMPLRVDQQFAAKKKAKKTSQSTAKTIKKAT